MKFADKDSKNPSIDNQTNRSLHNNFKQNFAHIFTILIATLLLSQTATAEIYKYQDENGKWYFSDKPKRGTSVKQREDYTYTQQSPSRDIDADLRKQYQPKNSIEEATMATISIETPMMSGSGFFVSDDGYIITNKHIIRPSDTDQWNYHSH